MNRRDPNVLFFKQDQDLCVSLGDYLLVEAYN